MVIVVFPVYGGMYALVMVTVSHVSYEYCDMSQSVF